MNDTKIQTAGFFVARVIRIGHTYSTSNFDYSVDLPLTEKILEVC
jgi:hypothetical protein